MAYRQLWHWDDQWDPRWICISIEVKNSSFKHPKVYIEVEVLSKNEFSNISQFELSRRSQLQNCDKSSSIPKYCNFSFASSRLLNRTLNIFPQDFESKNLKFFYHLAQRSSFCIDGKLSRDFFLNSSSFWFSSLSKHDKCCELFRFFIHFFA